MGFGEVVSETFNLLRHDLVKYFVVFAVVEVVIGAATIFAHQVVQIPTIPKAPTNLSWLPGYIGATIESYLIIEVATLVVFPIAEGATIKIAAEAIEGRRVPLGASVRFALSKLVWMWAVSLVVGVVVFLGFVALIVPGIILAIMFCLALPALLLENAGVVGSLSRSRELVSHRWGKTFVTFFVLGFIVVLIGALLGVVGVFFGWASPLATGILSGFYEPILPIGLTVYFFSNRARISPPSPTGRGAVGSGPTPQPGMKFCPNCGTQLLAAATFCSNCGAKQPVQA